MFGVHGLVGVGIRVRDLAVGFRDVGFRFRDLGMRLRDSLFGA